MLTAGIVTAACRRRQPEPGGPPIALWLGGDVHLGERGVLTLEGLASFTDDAIGIVNLEGPVSAEPFVGRGAGEAKVVLSNGPATLPSLKRAGVGVIGIANNHDDDGGSHRATAQALEAAGLGVAQPAGPAISKLGGRRLVVTAHDLTRGVPPNLGAALAAGRAAGDALVSTFHVTGRPSFVPRPELREGVELALAAGARVVAAHGTHAVGPVERRGEAVVAWGLGNLAFTCDCTKERDGAILRVVLHPAGVEAVIVPIDAGLEGRSVRPARDPSLMLDLFAAIGSSPLTRGERSASF